MQQLINLLVILILLGAVQALLLACALLSLKRGNRTANVMLAAFVANASILLAWPVLRGLSGPTLLPYLSRLNHPFDFAVGPLLYLYIKALTARRPELKRRDLLHFIPWALCALYLMPYYFQSVEAKLRVQGPAGYAQWYYVRSPLVILQVIVYLALVGRLVVRYVRSAGERSSAIERAALFQVKFLGVSLLALWVVAVGRYLFDLRYPAYMDYTNLVLPFGGTIIIHGLVYLSLRKPETLDGLDARASSVPDAHAPSAEVNTQPPVKKYEKSTLTSERSEVYLKKLVAVMEAEKPYTDGDLTLQKLASRLSVSAHHLSQIINERLNQNFFDFVNTYRVAEAKRLLVDPSRRHYSLLAIAEEVGFNSKSAFNVAFKKQTSMTPSEFRKGANGNGHH